MRINHHAISPDAVRTTACLATGRLDESRNAADPDKGRWFTDLEDAIGRVTTRVPHGR
jgi:hypothetical protein